MKTYLIVSLASLFFTFVSGLIFIPFLRKIKAGQPILKYVETHKQKAGTPTMGGLFFILPAAIVFFAFGGYNGKIATVSLTIGLGFMVVGFLDDFLKIKLKQNEGLKPYQKIIFQFFIAAFAGLYSYRNGLTVFYIPFFNTTVDLGIFTVFITALIFIAVTNSVNLTDGLDGLASHVSFVYLLFISVLILAEINYFGGNSVINGEYSYLITLAFSLMGAILGFLIFNVNKAKVFMGDTGSLSLGGFIGAISIFSSNSFFVPLIGIMFVLSSISVIVQVVYYKKTKKRVFLMAPLHHHFQLKGKSEAQICFYYALITFIAGAVSVISYL